MSTTDAKRKCAEFLVACKRDGWSEEYLDHLEKLWWQYHDEHGDFRARALLRSMDGQEPVAWTDPLTTIVVGRIGHECNPDRFTTPLYLHPSPQTGEPTDPRDELIMELVAELIKARTELFSCRPYLPPSGWSLAHERVQNADKMITKANEHGYTPER